MCVADLKLIFYRNTKNNKLPFLSVYIPRLHVSEDFPLENIQIIYLWKVSFDGLTYINLINVLPSGMSSNGSP